MAEHEGDGADGRLGLAEAIDLVRSELQRAAEIGAGEPLAFEPQSVEIELDVVFERSAGTEGGVKLWVVTLGARGDRSTSRTERLKVTLTPVERATGRRAQIYDTGPE